VSRFRVGHSDAIDDACFGVAGPVIDGHVETPNIPWTVDAAALGREIGLASVVLINDLVANAHGIFQLRPADFVTLCPGAPGAAGNVAVISAGTGLGEAGMYWDGRAHHPFACEGGHADFSPRHVSERLSDDLLNARGSGLRGRGRHQQRTMPGRERR